MPTATVVIPFSERSAQAATALARNLGSSNQVVLCGPVPVPIEAEAGDAAVVVAASRGQAIRRALEDVRSPFTVFHDADGDYPTERHRDLLALLEADQADAVFASRQSRPLPERLMGRFARAVTDVPLADPLSGLKAVRTEALRSFTLTSEDAGIDAELVVKLAAQQYRLAEIPVGARADGPSSALGAGLGAGLERARTLLRYATVQDDADNTHEGYTTLMRMEGAPHYNAWLGQKIRQHVGKRILEVGAGIGTITREIEPGAELVVALEVERFYVDRLKNQFRGKPHVRPYLSDVALADWETLRAEKLDTVVLSNVLEHIPDDASAVRRFGQVLQPGGKLVVLVPALPQLFGSIDEAVGHHRRYTQESLRSVLEAGGFEVERLHWMNLVGIPGWFMNGRVFKRRGVPPLQLRLYDAVAPVLARWESRVQVPVGMSLFAVARAPGGSGGDER